MKRAGLIALSMLLVFSLPATAASKNPYSRKARAQAKAPKPRPSAITSANPPLAKKQDSDPTHSWQSYSYP